MAEYLKKVDLLAAAVEVEYLGRPRMMVSAAKIGMMPSIEAVPMEYHDKVCEEMARRHQAEILELTADRPQGEWKSVKASIYPYGYDVECSVCSFRMGSSFGYRYCPMCGADMKGADDE